MNDVTGQPVKTQDTIQDPEPTRLLIVDEDPLVGSGLRHKLELMGYAVEMARSGRQAVALLEREPYDAMVLDWPLQGISGLEVMYWARQWHPGLIILLLTGSAALDSALEAVRLGANDYLTKPTSAQQINDALTNVLQAQVARATEEAGPRRTGESAEGLRGDRRSAVAPPTTAAPVRDVFHVPPLRLTPQFRQVVVEGDPDRTHNLTRGEARVLAALMEHAGEVLSCRYLALAALGRQVSRQRAQSAIRAHIFRLRNKIEPIPAQPCVILTMRGEGYTLAPVVEHTPPAMSDTPAS
jgi:DNA-binding response OmpR family regulator